MIEFLLLDLDNTILDFNKAEHTALGKTLRAFALEPTEAVRTRYRQINREYWERLERQELTREQVLVGRFETLFREFDMTAEAEAVARTYEDHLAFGEHHYLPGAEDVLVRLSRKYKMYLVTNGTAHVQRPKLKASGAGKYFRDIFISQDMGADKPSMEYFSRCFARIEGFDPAKTMIVGDSLTSDIRGGINAGIATCWFNPDHAPGSADIRPDYQIAHLSQLEALLESI